MPKVKLAGAELEISPLVASLIAIGIAIAFVLVFVWKEVGQPLISSEEASRNLQTAVEEYGKHLQEKPEKVETYWDDARGKLTVSSFEDGCVLLARSARKQQWSKLVVDLARDQHSKPFTISSLLPTLTLSAAGQCLNPHPGQFATWYGERNGCFIEVWRKWPDGCTHVQWFDTCHGVWDTNLNGTPRVRWTYCVH